MMIAFLAVTDKLITLFLLLLAGYMIRKWNVISDSFTDNLSGFLLKVTLPCLLVMSLQIDFTTERLKNGFLVFFFCIALHLFGMLIGILSASFFHIDYFDRGVWVLSCMFSNTSFMGIPVISAVLGQEAVFYCVFVNLAFNFASYLIGLPVMNHYSPKHNKINLKLKDILLTPIHCAIVFGLLLFLFRISIPSFLANTISSIGNLTTALAMLYIGAILTRNKAKEVFQNKQAYLASFARLVFIPLLSYFILKQILPDKLLCGVIILGIASPIATFCAFFTGEYGGDVVMASTFIFVSNLFCIFTMPFIALLFL